MKILIAKRFVILFENGVIVIKHWRMHNTLSANRYHETNFIDEKALLKLKDNKSYTLGEGQKIDDTHLIEMSDRQVQKNRQTIDEQKTDSDIDIDIDIDIDKKKNIYSANFEAFWKIYPRKSDKGQANKAYNARLKEGFSEDELLEAAKNYAEECKKDRREEKYIKLAKTFIGSSTPFVDYLPKQLSNGFEYDDEGNLLYNIDEMKEEPPFYSLPPQWFDQDNNLIKEKMTPIKQRALIERGFNHPIIYPVNDILEKYNMLKEYFDNLKNGTEG